jgi:NhaA family Na+:H+ antiporter
MPVLGKVVRPIQRFLALEASSGVLLLGSAVLALIWANLDPDSYRGLFDHQVGDAGGDGAIRFTVLEAINDGLMAVFFFVVGMQIKRELAIGELSTPAQAGLPAIAAVGGMIVPAAIYAAFNGGGPGAGGWGIPMATDIAFCVGILTLLKGRVPHALVVFLVALAIFDDIGGILVIAVFYGHGLDPVWLGAAAGVSAVAIALGRARVASGVAYLVLGVALWWSLYRAGIHATIAGVILGLAIPLTGRRPADGSPLDRFLRILHPAVAFGVMPLFGLGNAGVEVGAGGLSALMQPVALGTGIGLVAGKLTGIFAVTALAVRLGIAPMPGDATRRQLLGISILGGIGFTVALFIASLAFADRPALLDQAKLGILAASVVAGTAGYLVLRGRASAAVDRL